MIHNIEHNTIENYFNFIKSCNNYHINNTIVFYPIDNYYYLFYNENIGKNANDIGVKFENDGIYKKNGEIYFYVCFEKSDLNSYLENIKDNDIIILDNDFKIINNYKRKTNNLINKNKKTFFNSTITPKFYTTSDNSGIIQTSIPILSVMYSNYSKNYQKINTESPKKENSKEKICKSNASSLENLEKFDNFDNFDDIEIQYRFFKRNLSEKELEDYVVL